ncbi:GGDEF domain-containing protein [Weissella confusa]|uniref:GGDEF domain-containing protein n=1 Tax=Weissella confusa TaxID=1583 RepID=UPI0035A31DFD
MSNRRALDRVLEEVVPYFHTKRLPLTVVMYDIDSFKLINDTHGHAMGDYVLTRVAHIVNDTLIASNANGQVFRYGGEEFAIVFRNVKIEDILPKLETVMMAVRNSNFVFESQKANVTISMGVAELSKENDTAEAVMKKADDNLYDAKREGKNRIVLA